MTEGQEITFVIIVFALITYWLYRKFKKDTELLRKENTKLEADNALLKAEHLKFQLQPHTLKNILANLKVIASKLNKGMDSLSETLDYILYKGNAHLVCVEDEMNFIEKYLALNDLFTSEIDSIKLNYSNVNQKSKFFSTPCIPHLITAYFIENAFKHGDVNHPEFLSIDLKLTDNNFEMNVMNRVRKIPNESKGGIGLKNMNERLELLLAGNFEIKTYCIGQVYHSTLNINFSKS